MEGSEADALLLLLGEMLFLTYSAKGNPLGGLYILYSALGRLPEGSQFAKGIVVLQKEIYQSII